MYDDVLCTGSVLGVLGVLVGTVTFKGPLSCTDLLRIDREEIVSLSGLSFVSSWNTSCNQEALVNWSNDGLVVSIMLCSFSGISVRVGIPVGEKVRVDLGACNSGLVDNGLPVL